MAAINIPLLIMLLVNSCHSSMIESTFLKDTVCDVPERIDKGCSREVDQFTLLLCLADCGRNNSCMGASIENSTGKCFAHETCNPTISCETPENNHDYYSKSENSQDYDPNYCVHGTWNNDTLTCDCEPGRLGERCNKVQRTCNSPTGDQYRMEYIDPEQNGNLYKVYCKSYLTNSDIMAARNQGGLSFNRTWAEYENGFGSMTVDYWLGLKMWSILSNQEIVNVETRIRMTNCEMKGTYEDFVVSKIDDKYSFTYSAFRQWSTGTNCGNNSVGECLLGAQNTPFSTWDNDTLTGTNEGGNCPSLIGSGWWHNSACDNQCNLLGWDLQDWNNAPPEQRLSVAGVDMARAAANISDVILNFRFKKP